MWIRQLYGNLPACPPKLSLLDAGTTRIPNPKTCVNCSHPFINNELVLLPDPSQVLEREVHLQNFDSCQNEENARRNPASMVQAHHLPSCITVSSRTASYLRAYLTTNPRSNRLEFNARLIHISVTSYQSADSFLCRIRRTLSRYEI